LPGVTRPASCGSQKAPSAVKNFTGSAWHGPRTVPAVRSAPMSYRDHVELRVACPPAWQLWLVHAVGGSVRVCVSWAGPDACLAMARPKFRWF
jgi:hypothetical protein